MPAIVERLKDLLRSAPPAELVGRWCELDTAGRDVIERALRDHYFSQAISHMGLGPDAYLATEEGREDLANHVEARLGSDRRDVMPWLASLLPLEGVRVLEIGCGTGTSTVALTEQGAVVTGVDDTQAMSKWRMCAAPHTDFPPSFWRVMQRNLRVGLRLPVTRS